MLQWPQVLFSIILLFGPDINRLLFMVKSFNYKTNKRKNRNGNKKLKNKKMN